MGRKPVKGLGGRGNQGGTVRGRDASALAFPQTDGKTTKTTTCLENDWRSFSRVMDILGGAKTT